MGLPRHPDCNIYERKIVVIETVRDELERIAGDDNLKHLLQQKEKYKRWRIYDPSPLKMKNVSQVCCLATRPRGLLSFYYCPLNFFERLKN